MPPNLGMRGDPATTTGSKGTKMAKRKAEIAATS
jgi:hypothetical protein